MLHVFSEDDLRARKTASDGGLLAVPDPSWTSYLWKFPRSKPCCVICLNDTLSCNAQILNLSLNGFWFCPIITGLFNRFLGSFPVWILQDWIIIGFVNWWFYIREKILFLLGCVQFVIISSKHHGLMIKNNREIWLVLLFWLFCPVRGWFGRVRLWIHVHAFVLLDGVYIVSKRWCNPLVNPVGKAPLFLPNELFNSFRRPQLLLIGIQFGGVVIDEKLFLVACQHVSVY